MDGCLGPAEKPWLPVSGFKPADRRRYLVDGMEKISEHNKTTCKHTEGTPNLPTVSELICCHSISELKISLPDVGCLHVSPCCNSCEQLCWSMIEGPSLPQAGVPTHRGTSPPKATPAFPIPVRGIKFEGGVLRVRGIPPNNAPHGLLIGDKIGPPGGFIVREINIFRRFTILFP